MLDYFNSFGRLKLVKRTTGISTTALTGRLLALAEEKDGPTGPKEQFGHLKNPPKQQFLQMGNRVRQFSNNAVPKPNDRIVYYSASCDLFHPSVIRRIEAAKKQGDFLYVGLWDDEMIRYYRGN